MTDLFEIPTEPCTWCGESIVPPGHDKNDLPAGSGWAHKSGGRVFHPTCAGKWEGWISGLFAHDYPVEYEKAATRMDAILEGGRKKA